VAFTKIAGAGIDTTGNVVISNLNVSGIVTASSFVGNLTGTATSTTNIPNLTGDITSNGTVTSIASGVIVDADINASAAIADTKLATISTAGKVSNTATTATNLNTASAIVARDGSGNFSAGTITANLTGTASTASFATTSFGLSGNPSISVTGVNASGITTVSAGSTAAPSISPSGDSNTGIFFPSADTINASTGGTSRIAIDSNGNITLTNNFYVPLGSAAAPSISFTGDTNTGIYSPGADTLAISTNGIGRLTIDSSGNINIDSGTVYVDAVNNRLGIGTSSPIEILDCKGNIVLGAQNAASASLQPTSGSGTNIPGSALVLRSGRSTGSGSSGEIQILPSPGSTVSGTSIRGNGSSGFYMKLSPTSWGDHPTLGLLTVVLGTSISQGNRSGLSNDSTVFTIDGMDDAGQSALEIVGNVNSASGDQGFIRFYGSSNKAPYATIVAATPGVDYTSGNLAIRTYNAGVENTVATFTNTRRVGIRKTNPTHVLDVMNDTSGNSAGGTIRVDRPNNASFETALNWATNGTNQWFLGLDNDSTENLYGYRWQGANSGYWLNVDGDTGVARFPKQPFFHATQLDQSDYTGSPFRWYSIREIRGGSWFNGTRATAPVQGTYGFWVKTLTSNDGVVHDLRYVINGVLSNTYGAGYSGNWSGHKTMSSFIMISLNQGDYIEFIDINGGYKCCGVHHSIIGCLMF
jgi:hypothetical protein